MFWQCRKWYRPSAAVCLHVAQNLFAAGVRVQTVQSVNAIHATLTCLHVAPDVGTIVYDRLIERYGPLQHFEKYADVSNNMQISLTLDRSLNNNSKQQQSPAFWRHFTGESCRCETGADKACWNGWWLLRPLVLKLPTSAYSRFVDLWSLDTGQVRDTWKLTCDYETKTQLPRS